MPGPVAPLPCPKCGGQMWDNSNDPKRKANQSIYRCKDRQNCNGGYWKDSKELLAAISGTFGAAGPPAPVTGNGTAAPAPPRRPTLVLELVMDRAIEEALAITNKRFTEGSPDRPLPTADFDLVLRCAHSMFIARVDGKGIFGVEKAALEARAKKAREAAEAQAAETARLAAERAAKAAEERVRQASEPQVGAGASGQPEGDYYGSFPGDDDLPF